MNKSPFYVEDSDFAALSPLLSQTIEQLSQDADKFDHIMAFFIALMAQNAYRVFDSYNEETQ